MNSPATSSDALLAATGQVRKLFGAGLLFFGGLALTALRHLPALTDAPLTNVVIAGLGRSANMPAARAIASPAE